jgi:hypothetical protein
MPELPANSYDAQRNWKEGLMALEQGWDSYNGQPIQEAAIAAVGRFHVTPRSGGGLQIEYHADGYDIEIGVGPDGRISSVLVAHEVMADPYTTQTHAMHSQKV